MCKQVKPEELVREMWSHKSLEVYCVTKLGAYLDVTGVKVKRRGGSMLNCSSG